MLIENREVNDPISVNLSGNGISATITTTKAPHELPTELHISRFFSKKTFKKNQFDNSTTMFYG